MTQKISLTERELTLYDLGQERSKWLGHRAIAVRSSGMNGEAVHNQKTSMLRLDYLLDRLNDLQHERGTE